MDVYLDTVLWNRLCDQNVDATSLLVHLDATNSRLALGTEVVYELARTFYGATPDSARRGKNLLSYLKRFVELGIPCVRMTRDILSDEANIAAGSREYSAQMFLNEAYHADLLGEIGRLSVGVLTPGADEFIRDRKQQSERARAEIVSHYSGDLTRSLALKMARVPRNGLRQWMTREIRGKGRHVLRGHLAELFQATPRSELSLRQLMWVSKQLLSSPKYRVAQAMTRADLYANWRFAQGGSMSRDVPSDLYHVVNAAYCDVYATCDAAQEKYVPSILTTTRFALYTGAAPLEKWIAEICNAAA